MTAIETLKSKPVNQAALKDEFINYQPKRWVQYMALNNFSDPEYNSAVDTMFALDRLDYQYRRYLKGQLKTLHEVFRSLKDLPKSHVFEGLRICDDAYCIAVMHEFYELAARHPAAKVKMLRYVMKLQKEGHYSEALDIPKKYNSSDEFFNQ